MANQDPATDADLHPAVRELLARAQLRDLLARYARAIDRRDRGLLLSCYHAGASDDHGSIFCGSAREFVDWQPEVMAPFDVTAHYMLNSDIRIEGNIAEGETYFLAYHRTIEPAGREGMTGGRYLDRFECKEGEWRIAKRTLVWDFIADAETNPAHLAALRQAGLCGGGADDPSFGILPMLSHQRREPE